MKNLFKKLLFVAMAVTLSIQLWAANTKQTVEQVTTTVDLENDVDYIVTSSTPFTTDGIVNFVNTEHAVIILQNVKPSKAISMLATHVKINGAKAVNNNNCQVKIYNRGCIILPYGNSFTPLTVYSEKNFEGESADNFGLENDGGFMNTLTDAKLNNRIRSFKLKRGYMVTFSIKAKGRGYSRCFIAADKDIEMASLPAILDRSISSYRIFKWQDTGKQALANDTRASSVSVLNVTSCYSFGLGETRLPDAECVPHHIYENWPSPAECGSRDYSAHMKTNNEPRNSADDHPQDLETILANWENLMATGMRLCSPSSWDGSDYTNGTGFLKSFFDEIDARGWRCDIVDLHCYWPESNFGTISNWTNSTGRPVWISEWVWGASWNNNGAFANGVTETQNKEAVQRICNVLNNNANVERYYYWNSERNPSKLIRDDGSLTPAGQYYATINSGLGYKGKEFVPKVPPQVAPTDLSIDFDGAIGKATLTWLESNGEMNEYIYVQKRENSSQAWVTVLDVPLKEDTGKYTVSDIDAQVGWEFRITEKMANGTIKSTNTVMVVNNGVQAGDPVIIGEKTMYLGGNIIVNGSFDMGFYGWTNGQGSALDQPWFQVPAIGGADGNAYLQCYGNGGTNTVQAVKTTVKIEPNSDYYFMADACNMGDKSIARVGLSSNGTSLNGGTVASFNNTSALWLTSFYTFNSGANEYAIILLNTLNAQARFDNFCLFQLFDTKDEALADAAAKERLRAQAFMDYNPIFNSELTTQLATVKSDKQEDIDRAYTDYRYDSVTYLGQNAAGAVFEYLGHGDSAAVRLQSSVDISEDAKANQRVLLRYDFADKATGDRRDINVYACHTIISDSIRMTMDGPDSLPHHQVKLRSLWRTGEFINLHCQLEYTGKSRTFMLVADGNTLNDDTVQCYLAHGLRNAEGTFWRDCYASFNVGALWKRPSFRCLRLHINDLSFPDTDYYDFTKQ